MPVTIDPPPAIEAAASLPAPLVLFQAACFDGEATLDPHNAEPVSFREIPEEAQLVLRFAMPLSETNNWSTRPPTTSGVMRRIYHLAGERQAYLMLPDGGHDTNFKNVCAVIVEGATVGDVRAAILRKEVPFPDEPLKGQALPYLATYEDGFQITAAEHEGWAIAATVPGEVPGGDKRK